MANDLTESIESLRAEIRRIETTHPEDKERLAVLVAALERASHPDTDHETLAAHVRDAVRHFEERHPKVTTILSGVLNSLGGVGI